MTVLRTLITPLDIYVRVIAETVFHQQSGVFSHMSSCFCTALFIFLNFLFIVAISIKHLLESLNFSSKRKAISSDEAMQNSISATGDVTLGIPYQFSRWCCSVTLASHLTLLIILLSQEYNNECSYMILLFSETLQLVMWIIMSVSVFGFKKSKSVNLPWIIRLWWLTNFFQSFMNTSFKLYDVFHHGSLTELEDCINLLTFLASSYLLIASIRGSTGITFTEISSTSEPLLQSLIENRIKIRNESLYGKTSILQLVTFSWMNPIFVLGKQRPLEQAEVPEIHILDSARYLSESFDKVLRNVKEKYGLRNSSIYRTMFMFIQKKMAINACFAIISASASFVGPALINNFLKFLCGGMRDQGLERGYLLALAFLSAKFLETIAQRQWIFGARQLGLRLRAALISHIYKKGICLSNQSRKNHTSGEIINYMSVDVQRISDVMYNVNIIWMLPVQISLAIIVLHRNLGLGAWAGLFATLLIMLLNIPITRTQKRFQSKIMESKDGRMKSTSEVLKSMKTLKLQAWDTHFLQKLEKLREVESGWLWKYLKTQAISSFFFWCAPMFISVVTFGVCVLLGIQLTIGRVLSALATFQMLQDPIFNLPDVLSALAQAKVSADRIVSYLQEEEINSDAVEKINRNMTDADIEIEYGIFSWDLNYKSPTLQCIQLTVKRGMKVAICGTVGSGKSSLLSSILGEIPKLNGTVKISGTKAYVPQIPWILTGTVRENILFGNSYDREKYEKTIEACALVKDFELFANGDLAEIGERGINMSGGQKQRIQIARAVYQDADVYLLDDPFSAVDAHTGSHLFKNCLMQHLKDKTILYVTHQVEFLPAADLILVMENGRIAQAGKFVELLHQNIGFEVLVGAHNQAFESILSAENSSRNFEKLSADDGTNGKTKNIRLESSEKQDSQQSISNDVTEKGRITQDEEREKGSIGKTVYWTYLTSIRGGVLIPIIILAQCLFQIFQVASNYWMVWASPATSESKPVIQMGLLFTVYIFLSMASAICVLVRAMLVAIAGLLTAEKLFSSMLHCIIRAPMSFFDSTPTGRILNRTSTDQSVVDMEIAWKLTRLACGGIQTLGTVGVMSNVAWPVFSLFVPFTATCIWYQQYYISTARELARLTGIQSAPVLHHFAESLSGAATIRAFEQQERFISSNLFLVNNHSRPWFHNVSAAEWLFFRLTVMSNAVFAFSLILLVSLPVGFINPSIAGLAVTYSLNLNTELSWIIWNFCTAENKMISAERILQYSRIQSEAPLLIEECRLPNNWPETGTITFNNLQVRYAEYLPTILKNITFTIPGKKKVGVVGRTGSGKSTLIQVLFRIVEPREGSILIDGVDICKIGLHDLRSRLSIIPQDPTLFDGTVRGNLDPFNEYSDDRIWQVLDKCQLGELIRQNEKKLDSSVVENGENWSVGQKQLICLGRALLKRSRILVLDEATASVDSATDGIIQKTIREEFENCTVVTVAHRIHTVIDNDLIMVLSEGRLLEYDTPTKLLERENSAFSNLIKEYLLRSKDSLTNAEG